MKDNAEMFEGHVGIFSKSPEIFLRFDIFCSSLCDMSVNSESLLEYSSMRMMMIMPENPS